MSNPDLRLVKEEDGQHYPKASLWLRAGARVADLAIAWALFISTGPAGTVMALLFVLFADAMLNGQSPGKKIFGIRVVFLPTRQGARNRDSFLRNAPLGLVIILGMMPDLGFKAFIAGAAIVTVLEAVRVLKDPHGLRLGDLWAQTQVVDGKVAVGGQVPVTREVREARATGRLMRTASSLSRTPRPE